eukprot:2147268-Pleurochrysis_carterae.AAC.1
MIRRGSVENSAPVGQALPFNGVTSRGVGFLAGVRTFQLLLTVSARRCTQAGEKDKAVTREEIRQLCVEFQG